MRPGMTFTIEPMLTLGTHTYDMWDDGWTVVTKDRKRTAQFEHTLVVTADGAEVLTLPDGRPTRRTPMQTKELIMDHEIGLGIDIGGSGIKGAPVNLQTGELVADRMRVDTPQPSTPTPWPTSSQRSSTTSARRRVTGQSASPSRPS